MQVQIIRKKERPRLAINRTVDMGLAMCDTLHPDMKDSSRTHCEIRKTNFSMPPSSRTQDK